MKMKKFFALLLSLSMVLSLAACGSKGNSNDSQTDGETASDLHLGYDINTGENHYGPYYDEWSDKTDEELYEEALKEDTTINVYATSSKMMKVEEGFEAAYSGLDLVVSDLKTDEVLSERLKDLDKAIVPGFYGAKPDGSVKTFSRGGSDITGSMQTQRCDFFRKSNRIQLFPLNCQCDQIRSVLDLTEQTFSFLIFNLSGFCIAGMIRCLLIRHFHDFQFAVPSQTFFVFFDRLTIKFFFDFPYGINCNIHTAIISQGEISVKKK